jgi:cellulose synthase (UDP-forming)
MFPIASDNASILTIDLGVLLALLVMARLLNPARASHRVLFGLTTAAFLVIYALWRVCDTLPAFALSAQSLWPRLFIAFELIAILYTLMSILILLRSANRTAQADAAQLRLAAEDVHPAVDVFICTYDEPIDVVERSILSALALDYPRFTVRVLDETRRDWLRDYCASVGARHITRPDSKGAKAGNLNNGLAATARETRAPVILVLDADFAPRRIF